MTPETPRRYAFLEENTPRPRRDPLDTRMELKLHANLKTRIRVEAARCGLSMNEWIRIVLMAALDGKMTRGK